MPESLPNQNLQGPEQAPEVIKYSEEVQAEIEKESARISEIIKLATEMQENGESFPFCGINPVSYAQMKKADEQFAGYSTPTDTIIQRMQSVGMKVRLGENPDTGSLLILPADSDNLDDVILPRALDVEKIQDPRLKRLILLERRGLTKS